MELSIKNLKKSFGDKQVLKDVSIDVTSGKAFGILGRNGAGKSTTIRILMDVFQADGGQITIDDKPINRNTIKIGYLPEERGLYQKNEIMEQLIYFASLKGLNKKTASENAMNLMEKLEMTEYKNKKLNSLSKGNQQKIQLIVALISDPDIVILDEPFSGLDPVNATLLKDIVKELSHNNKLVLFSSHQMNYIEEFCNDIAILNDGNIVLRGNISDIKRNYDRSKIVVQSKEIDKMCKFLASVDIVKNTEIKDTKLLISMVSKDEKMKLFSILVENNFDIDKINVYEPTLTDIFVEYTREGL